jgi:RNA polymerase sigma-70 factor (ECF subfamily)
MNIRSRWSGICTGDQGIFVCREVFDAISALPDDFRDVLVAVDVAGLSYEEAARALRIKAASIPSRLSRARLRVAEALAS